MSSPAGPVVCVSYLALAELWTVPQFPLANHGTAIRSIEWSVAADGPMTAAALASMGAPALLIANDIGDDEHGHYVRGWLDERHVEHAVAARPELVTPRIVVTGDDQHTRTWFAYVPDVVASLQRADLSSLARASFIYLDCYELIEVAALRVIEAGRAAEVPLLLNLGGSELSPELVAAVRGYSGLLVQTNVDDAAHNDAAALARSVLHQTQAAWAIVTAGAYGAVALSCSELVEVSAFPVEVRHTHCAGAAFSAGLVYGLRAGWPMQRSMWLGSASGALRCARLQKAPLPTLAELLAMLPTVERPAAS
ncbi:carbohydrate kinase family protein [Nocardia nova]|uniref:Carbohydrate kinase family protein n=1 Tax=Nocardia nova TaxID=37330 RepID=A0A2S6AHP1_9NOCA|nr:carbohydrate kinase family protein [Nocardia nova]PPJ23133.1 carbohydrate kinase family protein [Nocardia nova]PPJ34743.1 carbohydrate kinase family protein [Nocardia nova]